MFTTTEGFIVGIALVAAMVSGFIGYSDYYQSAGVERDLLDIVYATMSLVFVEFDYQPVRVNWQLEIARWLAPFSLAYAAAKTLITVMRDRFEHLKIRHLKEHAVVFGIDKTSLKTVNSLISARIPTVIIESNPHNRELGWVKQTGAFIIIGNPADTSLLFSINIQKARYLLAVTDSDSTNIELIYQAFEQRRKSDCRVFLNAAAHIESDSVAEVLYDQPVFTQDYDHFSARVFNYSHIAARGLLARHGPDVEAAEAITQDKDLGILLVGNDSFIHDLILRFAKIGHYGSESRLLISVLGQNASTSLEQLKKLRPAITDILDLVPYDVDLSILNTSDAQVRINDISADIVYVCANTTDRTIVWTQTLIKLMVNVPIIVSETGSSFMLRKLQHEFKDFPRVKFVDLTHESYDFDNVFNARSDQLAIAAHNDYVERQIASGDSPERNSSLVRWKELPETLKDANRNQADHAEIKCRIITGKRNFSSKEVEEKLHAQNIERLSIMEHNRWVAEKRLSGWRVTSGEKNTQLRLSPSLIPWSELPEKEREKDREAIRNLPNLIRIREQQ